MHGCLLGQSESKEEVQINVDACSKVSHMDGHAVAEASLAVQNKPARRQQKRKGNKQQRKMELGKQEATNAWAKERSVQVGLEVHSAMHLQQNHEPYTGKAIYPAVYCSGEGGVQAHI